MINSTRSRLKRYSLMAILILVIYAIPLMIINVYPYGNTSLGVIDFKAQYLPFFTYFREHLFSDPTALIYSHSMGVGNNLFGLFTYYLSSPVNLLLFLFPISQIELGVYTVLMAKFILMAIFTSLFLEKYKINNPMNILLSLSYALSGYATVNFINPMWLDGMYLLPLLFMAIDKIIGHKKIYPFIIVYSLAVFSNFYIAYMMGVLSILYFLYTYFLKEESFKWKDFLHKGLLFVISAIVSVGVNIIPIFVTLHSLSLSKSELGPIYYGAEFNNPLDLFSKFYIGSNGENQIATGLPNLFIPSVVISLLILYFGINKISKREKILTGTLLGSLGLILYLPVTNFVLHGMNYPIWFQYRYSFVAIFFMIIVAARTLEHFSELNITLKKVLSITIFYIAFLVYFFITDIDYVLSINMVMSTLYMIVNLFILYFIQKETRYKIFNKNNLLVILLLISIMELSQNNLFTTMNTYSFSTKADVAEQQVYRKTMSDVYSDLENTKDYRTETTFVTGSNDNMLSGLKGISGFNSTYHSGASEFIRGIGYPNVSDFTVQNQYVGGNLFTDSVLNIKNVISSEDTGFYDVDESKLFTQYDENSFVENHHVHVAHHLKQYVKKDTKYADIKVYENDYAIGYGWLEDDLVEFDYSSNRYLNINELYSSMFDTEEALFSEHPYEIVLENLVYDSETEHYTVIDKTKDARLLLTYDNPKGNDMYSNSSVNDAFLGGYLESDKNGILLTNGHKISKPNVIMDTPVLLNSTKEKGNTLELIVPKEIPMIEFQYNLMLYKMIDTNIVKENLLSIKDTFKVDKFENTYISGSVDTNKETNLVMTIPYDSYWSVKVNDKPVETSMNVNALTSIPLEKGENKVEMSYQIPHLNVLIIITLLSMSFTIVYTLTKKEF